MRHLLDTQMLSRDDALRILDVAEDMRDTQSREVRKLPTLRGKTIVNLFFEDSTRTRISFEAAAKRLSADVINFSAKGSSVSKGESLQDTAQTLQATGGCRGHPPRRLRRSAHPRIERLDHRRCRQRRRRDARAPDAGPAGRVHDPQAPVRRRQPWARPQRHPRHDRRRRAALGVARSNVWLLRTLGAEVTLVAPPTLIPQDVTGWPVRIEYDLDAAIAAEPDAIMMLRIQLERMNAAYFPTEREYSRRWGLDAARLAALPDGSIVMHPGPMNRGLEISADAADSPRSTVLEQVANGVSVRMAALYLLLAGERALRQAQGPEAEEEEAP